MTEHSNGQSHASLVKRLLGVVIGMFAFGFALVPLYDVLCDVTGINGKTNTTAASLPIQESQSTREIRVQFLTRTSSGLSWPFLALTRSVTVTPGKLTRVDFVVENPKDVPVVAQAIPSVSPGLGAKYLHKLECFCFNQQPLAPGERKVMPMQFYVDETLPDDIGTLTLAYTLYDISDRLQESTAAVVETKRTTE
ncbi:cytochrome c oxidase assembly protein [Echinimonas agarilytica]|uniref:Cytochrome c oxidase assembly protein CtaG n=1 Tax=Echinimonas agarilytica TaxID=1215918 RepID=A0AA42B8I7_9GAMM|nr:cytochrome c oxidase assembly protein [Echinimonas agarilytica]MCM2680917.1 cytochrome c oxidase assembly protein [Echinimonas agarilytica]